MSPSSWKHLLFSHWLGLLAFVCWACCSPLSLSAQSYTQVDSLEIRTLVDSVIRMQSGNPAERVDLVNQIIKKSKAVNYYRGLVNGYNQLGNLYSDQGKFLACREAYLNALPFTDSIESRLGKGIVLDNLGSVERMLGNYPESMDYHQRARSFYEKNEVLNGIGSSTNNLAILYKISGSLNLALDEYKRALEIGRQTNKVNGIAGTLVNMSLLFLEIGDLDSAGWYVGQVFAMDPLPDPQRLSQAYSTLADIYLNQGKLDSALLVIEKGQGLMAGLGNRYVDLVLKFKEGNTRRQLGQTTRARRIFEECLEVSEEMGALEIQKSIYQTLSLTDEKEGDYKLALDNFKKMIAIRDSMLGEEQRNALLTLQEKYEFEKKEKEVAQLNLELTQAVQTRQEKELALKRSEKRIWVLIAVAALLLLVVGFVVAKLLGNARRGRLLKEKQELTERSLNEKEVLVSEVHHRVKNNLQVIYNILDLQSRSLDDEVGKQALQDSMLRVSSMSLVHNELYHQDNLSGIQMSTYFPRLLGHIQGSFAGRLEGLSLEAEVEESLWLDLDSAVPLGMVVNELVTNALKHAFPDGKGGDIRVRLKREGPALRLEVEDNGIGKSGNIRSGAFGSKLVKSLLRQLKGEMKESVEHGTLIAIVIRKFKEVKP